MAVTQADTFEIPLQVSDNVSKAVDKIVSDLNATIKKIPKSVDLGNIESELKAVSQNMKGVKTEANKINSEFSTLSSNTEDLNKQLVITSNVTNNVSQNMNSVLDVFNKINDTISDTLVMLNILFDIFQKLADKEFVKNLSRILTSLSIFFRIQGFNRIADIVDNIADKFLNLSLILQDLSETSGDIFETYLVLGRTVVGVTETLVDTFEALIETVKGVLLIGLINGLFEASKVLLAHKNLIEDVTDSYKHISRELLVVDKIINNTAQRFFEFGFVIEQKVLKTLNNLTSLFSRFIKVSKNLGIELSRTFLVIRQQVFGGINSLISFGDQVTLLPKQFSNFISGLRKTTLAIEGSSEKIFKSGQVIGSFANTFRNIGKQIFLGINFDLINNSFLEIGKSVSRLTSQFLALTATIPVTALGSLLIAGQQLTSVFGKLGASIIVLFDVLSSGGLGILLDAFANWIQIFPKVIEGFLKTGIVGTNLGNIFTNLTVIGRQLIRVFGNASNVFLTIAKGNFGKALELITSGFESLIKSSGTFAINFANNLKNINLSSFFTSFQDNLISGFSKSFEAVLNITSSFVSNFSKSVQSFIGPLGVETAKAFGKGFIAGISSPVKTFQTLSEVFSKGFIGVTESMTKGLSPAIFTLTEAGVALGPVLFGLGTVLRETDSALLKFAGTISLAVAVALSGFALIVTTVINKLSDLAIIVGDKLFKSMEKFESKFISAQKSVRAFEFTIERFGEQLGTQVVGNLEFWNEKITEIGRNTQFRGKEIRDSINLIIADTASLGFDSAKNFKLLSAATDIAANSGKNLKDVSLGLVKGLLGATQAAQSFGLVLTEEEIAHTDLAHKIEAQGRSLTNLEKTQARYELILNRGTLLQGAAADALETSAGAALKLNRASENLQIALGRQGNLVRKLIIIQAELIDQFTGFSPTLIAIIGVSIDLAAVFLKITGTIGKYVIIIVSLITAYKLLNAVFLETRFVIPLMNLLFQKATALVGMQAIAVNGLASVLQNIAIIIKGVVISSIQSLISTISSLLTITKAYTTALLSNPVFIKGSAIAASIAIVFIALSEFSEEIKEITNLLPDFVKIIGIVTSSILALTLAIKANVTIQAIFIGFVNRATFVTGINAVAVNGLSGSFLLLNQAVLTFIRASIPAFIVGLKAATASILTFSAAVLTNPIFLAGAAIAATITGVVIAVEELAKEVSFIGNLFKSSESQTKKLKEEVSLTTKIFEGFKDTISAIVSLFKTTFVVGISSAISAVLGLQLAWLSFKKSFADKSEIASLQIEIDNTKDKFRELTKVMMKNIGETSDAFGKIIVTSTAYGNTLDETRDKINKSKIAFKELREQLSKIDQETIKIEIMGNQFEKSANKLENARKTFNNIFDSMANGAKKSKENIDKLNTSFVALTAASIEFDKLRLDTFQQIESDSKSLTIEHLKASGKEIEAIKLAGKIRKDAFEKQVTQIKSIFTLTSSEESKIAQMRIQIAAQTEKEIQNIKDKAAAEATKKAIQAAKNQANFVSQVQNDTTNLKIQELQANNQFVAAQRIQNQQELQAFDNKLLAFIKQQELLDKNFKLGEKELDLINKQKDALIEKNKASIKKAGEKEQDAAQKAAGPDGPQIFGEQQVGLITSAFGEAAGGIASAASSMMGPASAMMAAAQMIVSAIQQLIDFIPNFINSVANIFNSLTDLPNAILDSVLNLEDAFDNFISNFIDNLIDAFPKIIKSLVRLSNRLLGAGITLAIQTAFKPKFWLDVGKAIVDGMVEGLMLAANDIANALGFDDIFDIKADEKLKEIGDEISRASNQLFDVVELDQIARGLDVADRIRNALASGSSRGASFFERLFKKIKQFGQDLWDGFVEAVGNVAKWFGDRGTEIWNGFILPIASWFGDRGTEIWNGFILPIANFFGDAGTAIWESFILPIGNFFGELGTQIWNGFILPIATFFGDLGTQIWNGFIAPIGNFFKDLGGLIWQGFIDPIGSFFSDLGKQIWDGLSSVISFPEIPTPSWIQTFSDAVAKLLSFKPKFSSGGLAGQVQNRISNAAGNVVSGAKDAGGALSSGFKRTVRLAEGGYLNPGTIKIPKGIVRDSTLYAQTGSFAPNTGTDTIDAKLTPGEFVVNREATRNNLGLLSFINGAKDPISPVSGTNNFSIVINAKTNLSADQVRREVVPELEKHLRRKSQEGRSVINAAGIRT